ncbi:unnamed protein product [Closterium sp. NIES-54]
MALRPSSVPQCVVLPSPPASSLPTLPDPESDLVRTASPTVTRLLATVVTDPSFESAAVSALVDELVDFATLRRLDYDASLDFYSSYPRSIGGELALGFDILEDRQFELGWIAAAAPHLASTLLCREGDPDALDIPTLRTYAEAITGSYSSQWQIAMDAEMTSWKSTSTYVDEVPPLGANIVDGMWIFRVKRPPGSPPAFKARYVARGFSQREGVDFFQTFSPTPKMTTHQVLLYVSAQRDYELHSLDFATAFLQGSLHEAIWTTLAALGFAPSTADPSLFPRTDTSLPPFYVLVYVDDLVFATADTEALELVKAKLQERHSCTDLGPLALRLHLVLPIAHSSVYRPFVLHSTFEKSVEPSGPGPDVLTGHSDASWADDQTTHRSTHGYIFSLDTGSVSWRSTLSSSVRSSSCEAEIYAGTMAAQELRWLTYLLTGLGEWPRSPPVLYVNNKAMIVLCQDPRLMHRAKHIALCYFLARELQQRGQLRLAYVATQANTADVFTKALGSSDHQHFCTALGFVPTLPHLLIS